MYVSRNHHANSFPWVYLVANVENVFQVLAHSVVLGGQKGRVEHDAEGDGRVEEHVMDDHVQGVLEAQPQLVVQAESSTAGTITIIVGFCNFCSFRFIMIHMSMRL